MFCFVLFFSHTRFLCNPSCPGTHSVDQAILKLTEIHLPLPPECWDERHAPPPLGPDSVILVYQNICKTCCDSKIFKWALSELLFDCVSKFTISHIERTVFAKIMPTEIPTKILCAWSNVYTFLRRLSGEQRRWDMGRRLILTSSLPFPITDELIQLTMVESGNDTCSQLFFVQW